MSTPKQERIIPLEMLIKRRPHIESALSAADELITSRAAYGLPLPDQPILAYSDIQSIIPDQGRDGEWWRLNTFFLSLWRRYKQILDVDATLLDMLNMSDLPEIPADDFRILPYPCFYVRLPAGIYTMRAAHQDGTPCIIDGFFVANDQWIDPNGEIVPLLRFFLIADDGKAWHYSYLYNAQNIRESARQKKRNYDYFIFAQNANVEFTELLHDDKAILPLLLRIVLYIVSQGADTEQRVVAASDPSPQKKARLKDQYKEISFWDVGVRVGAKWRQSHSSETHTGRRDISERSPVRPHIRRGHYHHFWTGSHNDPSSRKLIVKWLPPVMVAPSTEEQPTTIRKLK